MPAFADNIANCEVVLMERIEQEGLEGAAEVASFRPAGDFLASVYSDDEQAEILREIDELPIRAVMCERQSLVPSLRDFPIAATGIPFMISQHFDSTETGLTTIFFKDGKFQHSYKGPELDAEIQAELEDRIEVYNFQPHDLAEKEAAMKAEKSALVENVEEVEIVEEALAEDITFQDAPDHTIIMDETFSDNVVLYDAPDEAPVSDIIISEDTDWNTVISEDILPEESLPPETTWEETVQEDVIPDEASTEIWLSPDDILAESANQESLDIE